MVVSNLMTLLNYIKKKLNFKNKNKNKQTEMSTQMCYITQKESKLGSPFLDLSDYDAVFTFHEQYGIVNYNSILNNLEKQLDDQGVPFPELELQTASLSSICDGNNFSILQGDNMYVTKLIEDILILLRNLNRSETKADYIVSIVTFAKLRSTKPLLHILLEQWDRLMSLDLQTADGNNFSKLRNILDNYESTKNLPVFKKLYKFLMYCIGVSLFEKLGVKFDLHRFMKVEKAAIKKEYYMGPDFIHCLLDTILFFCETGQQCMVTGTLDPIFHHETTYDKWLKEAELLQVQSSYISNPEPHGFTVFDFLSRLDDAIEKGSAITKFHSKSDYENRICKYLLNTLKGIRADCLTKRLAQQDRKAPFAVLVAGGSSVGKSTFTKMLYYHFGKLFNLPIDPEYRYVRNPFDQYWTNFNSSQWCVQLDDIAFMHPNKAQGCDPSLMEMLQVVNNVPYVPTQADLSDKGKTPIRSRFVVATTNTESLNAKEYFACPLAVQRRLPYVINIVPRKEYLRDDCMLDTASLPKSCSGEYPNFWRITIKKVVPTTKMNTHMGQVGELKDVAIFEDTISFLEWFNKIAKESEGVQSKTMDCDTHMSEVEFCDCMLPLKQCKIHGIQMQSEDIVTYNTPWVQEMHRRLETNSDERSDPVEGYFMKNIMLSISSMNIFTKIVVFWYWCILHFTQHFTYGPAIVSFFLGRWYFFIILCRLLHIPEMRKLAFYLLGHKAYRSICRDKKAVIFCATLVTAISIYKAFSLVSSLHKTWTKEETKCTIQGLSEERGVTPKSGNDKHENVWYKDVYECTSFDVTPSTLSKAQWDLEQMEELIKNNCVHLNIRYRTSETELKEKKTKAICIGGCVYMLNNHAVSVDSFEIEVIMQNKKDGITTNITVLVTPIQYIRYPQKDLMFITLPIPPKKDIRDLFAKESFAGRFDGKYFGRSEDGDIFRNNICAPRKIPDFQFYDEANDVHIKTDMWHFKVDELTKKGDCGATLMVQSNFGPLLLGIHILGATDKTAYAVSVSSDFLNTVNMRIINNKAPTLQVGNYSKVLSDLSKKSPLRWIEQGTMQVFGSFVGFRSKKTSKVCKTYISDIAVDHGYKRETDKPMMNSWVPWRKALLDMTRPVTHMDLTLLDHCRQCFQNDIILGLKDSDYAELVVYDDLTAINGAPGLAYVDKINRSTSAGFPFGKSKKFFMENIEPIGGLQNPVEVTPEIKKEVDEIIKTYEGGSIYNPIFTGSLKDEPTNINKCKEGKTRVFCGAPLPWCIVVRKYLLAIIRLIQLNRFLFESGPGTIAQSIEWDQIYKHITAFGLWRIVAGDYGKFDKRMPASVILAAFEILIALLRKAGWSERDISVVIGISYDTAFPCIDLNGDFIKAFGSNPSGHPLTVIINGIANSLYVRYCYAKANPAKTCVDFKKHINLMTYGDDMIMGVSPQCTWLNHTVMRDILADVDIEFTMADKLAPSVPFIHIDNATFLRRAFRYEPELNAMVCPIEHASIDKMLTMCVKSQTISMQLHSVEVMNTVTREYFWYGKEIFEEKRELMNMFIKLCNLQKYQDRPFPTWEQLKFEFNENSKLRN